MNPRITTYEDLMLEKHRLKLLLHAQKEQVREDIDDIKVQLAPVKSAISFIGKMTTKDPGNPLINGTINTVIDLVVRKIFLARAGWFTKLVVPFFLKNYSSHLVDEKKDSIVQKIFSWFKGKKKEENLNGHGKEHYFEEELDDE
jgi:hypothetical protein